MCGGKKEGQVTAVESVNADGSGKDGDKKTPPMTPKDKEQVSDYQISPHYYFFKIDETNFYYTFFRWKNLKKTSAKRKMISRMDQLESAASLIAFAV